MNKEEILRQINKLEIRLDENLKRQEKLENKGEPIAKEPKSEPFPVVEPEEIDDVPLSPQMEMLEGVLENTRKQYALAYKEFMSNANILVRTKRKFFGANIKESKIPPELKKLEAEYDKAAIALGNEMFAGGASKTEIFKKVVMDEQEMLSALKAENLPPKEKGVFRKGFEWYMSKKWYTKMAISLPLSVAAGVGITFVAMPGMVATAGGTTAYASMRVARALGGIGLSRITTGGLSALWKDKSGKIREEAEEELKKVFEISDLTKVKKDYTSILEQEKKSKRRRNLAIAGASVLAGGAANIGVGYAYGIGRPSTGTFGATETPVSSPTPTPTGTPPVVDGTQVAPPTSPAGMQVENFVNQGVKIEHGRGAIWAVKDLQNQIKAEYPDISKAPESVQNFVKADAIKETIRLGFYDPNNLKESALIQEGSILKFDENGKLLFGKPDANGNIPPLGEKYQGKMFDSDRPKGRVVQQHTTKTIHKAPEAPVHTVDKIEPQTLKTEGVQYKTGTTIETGTEIKTGTEVKTGTEIKTGATPIQPEPASSPAPSPTPEEIKVAELKTKIEAQIDLAEKYPELKNTPFAKNNFNLPEAELVEVNKVYQKLYTGRDGSVWVQLRDQAADAKEIQLDKNDDITSAAEYFTKVQELSGLEPKSATLVDRAETIGEYMARALANLAKRGLLDKVKY